MKSRPAAARQVEYVHWCASCGASVSLPGAEVMPCGQCPDGLIAPSFPMAKLLRKQQRRLARLRRKLAASGFEVRCAPGDGLPGWAVHLGCGVLVVQLKGGARGPLAHGWRMRLRGLDGLSAFARLVAAGHVF